MKQLRRRFPVHFYTNMNRYHTFLALIPTIGLEIDSNFTNPKDFVNAEQLEKFIEDYGNFLEINLIVEFLCFNASIGIRLGKLGRYVGVYHEDEEDIPVVD